MICFKLLSFLILYIFASPIDTTSGGDFIKDEELKDITKILAKHRVNVNLTSVYERGMAKPKKKKLLTFLSNV